MVMASGRGFFLLFLLVGLMVGVASSSPSPSLSDGVFRVHGGSAGRSLLQAKKSCPVNFEFLNYTIITSKCKGPQYAPTPCCAAFKQFACPYIQYLNDESNDCASTMFSYINLYGKYPPGLFASECREGKQGLACEGVAVQKDSSGASVVQRALGNSLALIALLPGLVALLFH